MKLALILNVVDPLIGGVLIMGHLLQLVAIPLAALLSDVAHLVQDAKRCDEGGSTTST